MTGYYDYVLGLIPAALIGITAVLSLAGLPMSLAVPVGATVAIGLMGHAMFVRSPVATPSRQPASSSSGQPSSTPNTTSAD